VKAASKYKQLNLPKQPSEIARLKVVAGPDYGCVFVLTSGRATIGRGEDSDVVLSDLKASRKHAELLLSGSTWSVKDAGSSNGILHNGKVTRVSTIRTLDTVTLGETTLEFIGGEAGTGALMADPKSLAQIKSEQNAFQAQQDKVRQLGVIGGVKVSGPNTPGAPGGATKASRMGSPRMIMIAVGGIAAYMILSAGDKPATPQKKREPAKVPAVNSSIAELGGASPPMDPQVARTAEQLFKSGFREYGQGNYLRAKQLFETVLQIAPGHRLAVLYMENCTNAIDSEVKKHLELGRKDFEAGKLRESKGHYEAVLRLKFREPTSPPFNEAREQLEKVVKSMQTEDTGVTAGTGSGGAS
jgi:pSer/pThr/pTyr-binding forkhead associated (FHA) protein